MPSGLTTKVRPEDGIISGLFEPLVVVHLSCEVLPHLPPQAKRT